MNGLDYSEFYADWGFWFFLIQSMAVALTALVPPLPAEFMVIGSGTMAAEGVVPLSAAWGSTFLGCLAGDIGLYSLFRYKFIKVLYRWKSGRLLHRKILRISLHTGGTSTWFGLLLIFAMPFGRSAAMATAGMMKLSWPKLMLLAVVGGAGWSSWLAGLGYGTTRVTDLPAWGSTVLGILMGTLAGAVIAYIGTRGRRVRL